MTASEAFRNAFVAQCKSAGLDDVAIVDCLDRAASMVGQIKQAGGVNEFLNDYLPFYPVLNRLGGSIAEKAPGAAAMGYLGIPIGAGALGGLGLAKLQDLNDEDPKEMRTRESIDNYRRLSQEMTIRNRLNALNRPTRARSPIIR